MSPGAQSHMRNDHDFSIFPLFQGMEEDLLQGLVASARPARFDKGKVFLEQGQPATRYYIILDGWCGAVKSNAEGQESVLQLYRRGDFLPDPRISLSTAIFNLQALTDVHVAMLPPTLVRNALERSKPFAANMLVALARYGEELRHHVEQLTLHDAEHRVGRFILDMRLSMPEQGKEIVLPFDKSLIAAYLGIKPETLSRALQAFKERGFIVDRNHIGLPDPKALCDYCDALAARHCRHYTDTDKCPESDRESA